MYMYMYLKIRKTCLSTVADSHSNRDRHTNFKTIILYNIVDVTDFNIIVLSVEIDSRLTLLHRIY